MRNTPSARGKNKQLGLSGYFNHAGSRHSPDMSLRRVTHCLNGCGKLVADASHTPGGNGQQRVGMLRGMEFCPQVFCGVECDLAYLKKAMDKFFQKPVVEPKKQRIAKGAGSGT